MPILLISLFYGCPNSEAPPPTEPENPPVAEPNAPIIYRAFGDFSGDGVQDLFVKEGTQLSCYFGKFGAPGYSSVPGRTETLDGQFKDCPIAIKKKGPDDKADGIFICPPPGLTPSQVMMEPPQKPTIIKKNEPVFHADGSR